MTKIFKSPWFWVAVGVVVLYWLVKNGYVTIPALGIMGPDTGNGLSTINPTPGLGSTSFNVSADMGPVSKVQYAK